MLIWDHLAALVRYLPRLVTSRHEKEGGPASQTKGPGGDS